MGLYDRDYGRDDYGWQPGIHLDRPRSLTTNLVILTIGVYVVQLITAGSQGGGDGWFTNLFELHADFYRRPWLAFQLLTYGFLHAPQDAGHIAWNMLGLWFLGRTVESRYGQKEYLFYYLASIVFAGAFWLIIELISTGGLSSTSMLGASGGISAVLVLFALNYPNVELSVFGLFPVRAWMLAVSFIAYDVYGAIGRVGNTAFTAHLGGALFAYIYFKQGWKLSQLFPSGISFSLPKRKPKLRVHVPDEDQGSDTDKQVDEILRKINDHGQDSLTWRERRILERASREYQKKR